MVASPVKVIPFGQIPEARQRSGVSAPGDQPRCRYHPNSVVIAAAMRPNVPGCRRRSTREMCANGDRIRA